MNTSNWGGKREGSGRKPTGKNIVNMTLTFQNARQAEIMRSLAKNAGLTVSQLVIKRSGLEHVENTATLPESITGNRRLC